MLPTSHVEGALPPQEYPDVHVMVFAGVAAVVRSVWVPTRVFCKMLVQWKMRCSRRLHTNQFVIGSESEGGCLLTVHE